MIASGAEPQYTTDPPTSGPHTPGALPGGVLTQPLARPSQVGALEAGLVLIQYRDLDSTGSRHAVAARRRQGRRRAEPRPARSRRRHRVAQQAGVLRRRCAGAARIHPEPSGPRPWHRRVRTDGDRCPGESRTATTTSVASGTRHRRQYDGSCEWRWAGSARSRTRRRRRGRCGSSATAPVLGSTAQPSWCWRTGHMSKAVERLPPDLPLGYHDLHPDDGGATTRLIVTPERCHVRDGERSWGWAAQLYATRSSASWGIGDFADLRTLARWSAATRRRLRRGEPAPRAALGRPTRNRARTSRAAGSSAIRCTCASRTSPASIPADADAVRRRRRGTEAERLACHRPRRASTR